MILKLKDILSNPFRDLKANPLIEEKIVGLMESINLTGFWENVVVRKNADGKYELAYGHHRLAAALRAGIVEADFIVKKFDDAKMIQVMDNENRETYGATPQSIIESVKAVVQSLAKGTIPAFEISKDVPKTNIRYAPSYAPGEPPAHSECARPYTALSIAIFLGRTYVDKRRESEQRTDKFVTAALDALFLKEKGRFYDSMLKKKDETGAIVPITMNELRTRTATIKKDYAQVAARTVEAKAEAARLDAENRRIQAERKLAEETAEAARQKTLRQLAEARKDEDTKRAAEIKERLAKQNKKAEEKEVLLKIRQAGLNAQVEERKKREAEARKEDAYMPIKREVERILHKIEGSTSTTKEALAEEVKALARKDVNLFDKNRLHEAAVKMAEWYEGWLAIQFLPKFGVQKELANYRSREEAARRVREAKEQKEQDKKLKKEKRAKA